MPTETATTAERWKLEDIFTDDADYERARAALDARLPELEAWRGRLGETPGVLLEALDALTDAARELSRLRSYAGMKSDQDTRVPAYQALRQGVEMLATRLAEGTAWVRPEILALTPEAIEIALADEPRLATHAFFLRDLIRQREHVLGAAEERILSNAALLTGSPATIYGVLHSAELPRPEIELNDGTLVRLTPVEFHRHRGSPRRDERLRLFPAYFSAYSAMRDTLAHNLYAGLKTHLFRARTRGYPSCLAAALDRDRVPQRVYRNLIVQVRSRLSVMHRYFRLRARALGLERLEYPDLYCPLTADIPDRYTAAGAERLVVEGLAPLGEGYVAALKRAFRCRWIDWHPAPGKRSGAYASGGAYDVHPYVLLNFTGDFESVSTLAHEMGHAMHSYFANRAQPFATADYSIFVAEVASTLNEALLLRRLLDAAADDRTRAFLHATVLDGMRGTLFRQTMFAEFELEIHERVERGEPLTGESLDALFLRLLREYHGHDEGVTYVDERYAVEWAAVPHFYYDFYVYQYATGIVASTALAEALVREGASAGKRYLEFLAAGGSDYPLELLRRAGVDLEAAAPYDAAITALERHLDRLERLLDSA